MYTILADLMVMWSPRRERCGVDVAGCLLLLKVTTTSVFYRKIDKILYGLSQKMLKTTENKMVTHLRHKEQFSFIFGNELLQWTINCSCCVRSSGRPGSLRQSITAIPLIFIPLLHIWGF